MVRQRGPDKVTEPLVSEPWIARVPCLHQCPSTILTGETQPKDQSPGKGGVGGQDSRLQLAEKRILRLSVLQAQRSVGESPFYFLCALQSLCSDFCFNQHWAPTNGFHPLPELA